MTRRIRTTSKGTFVTGGEPEPAASPETVLPEEPVKSETTLPKVRPQFSYKPQKVKDEEEQSDDTGSEDS